MAGKSIGSLNVSLGLSTKDFSSGLDKARRDIESFQKRVTKQTGVELTDMFGGGGMGSVRDSVAVRMRRARESYMGRGTAEQQMWQSSIASSARSSKGDMGFMASLAAQAEKAAKGVMVMGTAMRGAEVALGLLNRQGKEWNEIFEPMRSAPLGVGQAWSAGWDLGQAVRRTWKGDEQGQADWEAAQADKEARYQDQGRAQAAQFEAYKKQMKAMSGASADAALLAGTPEKQREAMALNLRYQRQLEELQDRKKAMLDQNKAGTYGEQFRGKIAAETAAAEASLMNEWKAASEALREKESAESAKASEERFQNDWEKTKRLYALDTQIAQARLRMKGRADDAERYATAARYEEQIAEAKRAGETEVADRLTLLKDLELKESALRNRRLQEVDFSSMAGTGNIVQEKTRDVLMSIDRKMSKKTLSYAG